MTEATDRPRDAGEVGATAPTSAESYRPLSLLAMAGFGLAVLYVLVVLIGAAVALLGREPWLMPNWTFFLPVAALVVCWAARTRIRDSEGTLSGLAFTTWGFRLTIVVGLTYAAYYSFTFFAIRLQATQCAGRFLEHIKQGHPEQAFLFAQGVDVPEVNDELRDTLQSRFNNPMRSPAMTGPFTHFRQMRFVRFIEMAGPETNITLRGVNDWQYEKGAYRVVLKYHVSNVLGEFELHVETFGRDAKPDEPKGRKWEVSIAQGLTDMVMNTLRLTPQGEELKNKSRMAQNFASAWVNLVNERKWDEAYLDTLKPSERSRVRGEPRAAGQNLASRQLIHRSDKFWAGKKQRDDIVKCIDQTFQPGIAGNPSVYLTLQEAMPLLRVHDGQTTVFVDVSLRYQDESSGQPLYIMEGRLAVSTQASDADTSLSVWRIESLDIESGRTPPASPPRARQAGPPGKR